jgi:hypothetical protein
LPILFPPTAPFVSSVIRGWYNGSKGSVSLNTSARGYNWATLFLGDIITGTWPFRLGSLKRDCKIWPWVLRDFDPRVAPLARPRSNCTVNYRPVF